MVRHAETPSTVVAPDQAATWLAPLPIATLRLPRDTVGGLSRLGFGRIEQLMTAYRAPIVLRFGGAVHRRLDQALGRGFEPIEPVVPPEKVGCRLAIGFNSGEYGGSVTSTMLSGTVNSRPVACQPAPSHITAATAPGATCELISSVLCSNGHQPAGAGGVTP
jgi:hypothetical protein